MMGGMCTVSGCETKARSGRALYCEKHYGRLRRGSPLEDPTPPQARSMSSHGYVVVSGKGHPLNEDMVSTSQYEHRIVLYDALGAGPLDCHVCGASVTWDILHVDHLNDCKTDNRPENLRPSCPTCNQARGRGKMTETHRRNSKYRITFDGRTMCLSEWADVVGVSKVALRQRLVRGWSIEDALTKPSGTYMLKTGRPKATTCSI